MMARLRFGRFEFDPDTRELFRDGTPRALPPQPARFLAALLARPGELVTRDELRQALWEHDTHVDFEKGLNFCAAQVRAALGDAAAAPQFVETVPKRGYRFVAALAVPAAPAAPAPASQAQDPPAASRPPRPVLAIALAAICFAASAGVLLVRTVESRRLPIVAVAPFQNETGRADQDRTAKGISDTTVARLADPARLRQLKVVGNAASLRFTFRPPDLKAMGEGLGAEFIVLGQVKEDAAGFRVVAHLIRVSDQTHVWAETFDRAALSLADQAAVAEAIATAVAGRVTVAR
jgi:TolB-like protein/DNA-binding winged helix-turn-helix (wHTH) protein